MVSVVHGKSTEPALFSGDAQRPKFWRCDACGEAITPDRPGIARWAAAEEPSGMFDVVHHAQACDDGKADRWEPLERFMAALTRNSLGRGSAAGPPVLDRLDAQPYGIDFERDLELNGDEAHLVAAYQAFAAAVDRLRGWMIGAGVDEAQDLAVTVQQALADILSVVAGAGRLGRVRRVKIAAASAVVAAYNHDGGVRDREFYLRDLERLPDGPALLSRIEEYDLRVRKAF